MTLPSLKPYRDLTVLMTLARGLPFLYCPRTSFYIAKVPHHQAAGKARQANRKTA